MPSPEPWEVVHPDPNLHLNGIKWGTEAGVRAGEFTVTLTGHWAVEVRMVGAKGPDVAWGEIAGPIPADTTCVGASAPATSGYVQYDATDDLIRWQGDLAPGQTVTVTLWCGCTIR